MNWKIVSGSLCLSWGILLSAQQLTENLRRIPGGIEIVERENAATSAFDPGQRLKTGDQRVLIDFMDLSSSKQSGKLKTDPKTGSQEGTIEVGREKLPFAYTSRVEKSDEPASMRRLVRDPVRRHRRGVGKAAGLCGQR